MKLLENIFLEVQEYTAKKKKTTPHTIFRPDSTTTWPKAGNNNIVLIPDLGLELGNPDSASVSFLSWTMDKTLVNDNQITLIGPDIKNYTDKNLPLGKIVLVEVEGINENNAFEKNREMFLAKFDISLKGFMVKSASQYMAEWWRISKEAILNNFSLEILGKALINEYKKIDYIKGVEIIFVTSSVEDVNELFGIGNRNIRTINAMSKMVNEMNYNCEDCEYQDICDDADELRELRETIAKS